MGSAARLGSVLGLMQREPRFPPARVLALAVLALAALSAAGCATDGRSPDGEPRYDPRPREWQQPGFTPFSA